MKVLITGATGFLGSHLVQRMVAEGHRVRILARPASSLSALQPVPVEVTTGDVTDPARVVEAVRGCDIVIHAAGRLHSWGSDCAALEQVNVEGTRNVAQLCRQEGVKRLIHVSSVAAIGIPETPEIPANEEFVFNVDSKSLPYHSSKHRAEEIVLEQVAKGLDAVIVNPAAMFGPYGETYRGGSMLRKIRRSAILPAIKGGICVVHVEDVVDGILAALRHGLTGHRYILGGENISLRSVAEQTAKAMGLKRIFVPTPPIIMFLAATILEIWGRVRRRRPYFSYSDCQCHYHYYSSDKARRMLGYAPRTFPSILDECLRMHMC